MMADVFEQEAIAEGRVQVILSRKQAAEKKAETDRRIQQEDAISNRAERGLQIQEKASEQNEALFARKLRDLDKRQKQSELKAKRIKQARVFRRGLTNPAAFTKLARTAEGKEVLGEDFVRSDAIIDTDIDLLNDRRTNESFDAWQAIQGDSAEDARLRGNFMRAHQVITRSGGIKRVENMYIDSVIIGAWSDNSSDENKSIQASHDFVTRKDKTKGTQSADVQLMNKIGEDNPDFTSRQVSDEFIRIKQGTTQPASVKKDVAAKEIEDGILKVTGSKDIVEFTKKELTGDQLIQGRADLDRRDRIIGKSIPREDKDLFSEIALITKGAEGIEKINPETLGLIDNVFIKFKNSFFEDSGLKDDELRAAYSQIQVVQRKLLFGAALTPTEIASFNQAFGSLDIKDKKVLLSKFKQSMIQIQTKMRTLQTFTDVFTFKIRMGTTKEGLNKVISNIDAELVKLTGESKDKNSSTEVKIISKKQKVKGFIEDKTRSFLDKFKSKETK